MTRNIFFYTFIVSNKKQTISMLERRRISRRHRQWLVDTQTAVFWKAEIIYVRRAKRKTIATQSTSGKSFVTNTYPTNPCPLFICLCGAAFYKSNYYLKYINADELLVEWNESKWFVASWTPRGGVATLLISVQSLIDEGILVIVLFFPLYSNLLYPFFLFFRRTHRSEANPPTS